MTTELFGLPVIINESLAILVPLLMFVGRAAKKGSWLQDEDIPAALGIVGALLGVVMLGIYEGFTATTALNGAIQGAVCGGLAVYGHQTKKQADKASGKY